MTNSLIEITLKPTFCVEWPKIILSLDDEEIFHGRLEETTEFKIERPLADGNHELVLDFFGKTTANTSEETDQGVEITKIAFDYMDTDVLFQTAEYHPRYPDFWIREQKANGVELETVKHACSYIGWNGTWTLKFSAPLIEHVFKLERDPSYIKPYKRVVVF